MFTYTFETSQPLTKEQLAHINKVLSDVSLPSVDSEHLMDVPEWTTDVSGPVVEEGVLVTYLHKDALDGPRYRQYQEDAIPEWAVDVKIEQPQGVLS